MGEGCLDGLALNRGFATIFSSVETLDRKKGVRGKGEGGLSSFENALFTNKCLSGPRNNLLTQPLFNRILE